MTRLSFRLGWVLAALLSASALLAPVLATNPPDQQFLEHTYAPPMWPRIRDEQGRWRRPFVYPVRLVDRLELRFVEQRGEPLSLRFFANGRLVSVRQGTGPWLPLGGDALGRDVYSRLLFGARLSLGVALIATAAALLMGSAVGAVAGFAGGRTDLLLMLVADFFIVLPAIYVVLVLRATMPLILTTTQLFSATAAILALAGWPLAARGVRAVIAVEKNREYAESARSAGASGSRILLRHLLPATQGILAVQASLLLPAFVMAESTLSYVGLGFSEPSASWGGLLRDAARGRGFVEAPWLLTPALTIALSILSVHLLAGTPQLVEGSRRKPGWFNRLQF
jgi:peptide/nickel transport system permease protein